MNIDKIISLVRTLKEESSMMTTASTPEKAGFGGSAQGFDPGPTSGIDKKIGKNMNKRKYFYGKRKYWLDYLKTTKKEEN
jgi:hypothetical protein